MQDGSSGVQKQGLISASLEWSSSLISIDSGASLSIINKSYVGWNKFSIRNMSPNKWPMMAASFLMLCEAAGRIKISKLNTMAHIFAPFYITSQKAIMM